MNRPIFITGIGTGVGKTIISAIVTEALRADYWKPVQAGLDGTDSTVIKELVCNAHTVIHPELYRLHTPASPHIAARIDDLEISIQAIKQQYDSMDTNGRPLIIEGAGGLLVPLTNTAMVADLIEALDARVILVSRNYLGSINHSLLTAAWCRTHGIDVAGWIFNDDYMNYEAEIVNWSGYPSLGSVRKLPDLSGQTISAEANRIRETLSRQMDHLS